MIKYINISRVQQGVLKVLQEKTKHKQTKKTTETYNKQPRKKKKPRWYNGDLRSYPDIKVINTVTIFRYNLKNNNI